MKNYGLAKQRSVLTEFLKSVQSRLDFAERDLRRTHGIMQKTKLEGAISELLSLRSDLQCRIIQLREDEGICTNTK